jgi:hypothetical protein
MLLVAALAALATALPAQSAPSEPSPVLSPIVVSVVATPNPVLGANNRVHLAYELSIVNQSQLIVGIDAVKIVDAANDQVIQHLDWKAVDAQLRLNSRDEGGVLAARSPRPAHSMRRSSSGVLLRRSATNDDRIPLRRSSVFHCRAAQSIWGVSINNRKEVIQCLIALNRGRRFL